MKIIAILFSFAGVLCATTVTESGTCSISVLNVTLDTQTSPTGCFVQQDGIDALASVDATISNQPLSTGGSVWDLSLTTIAETGYRENGYALASASASASIDTFFYAPGPARPGFIDVLFANAPSFFIAGSAISLPPGENAIQVPVMLGGGNFTEVYFTAVQSSFTECVPDLGCADNVNDFDGLAYSYLDIEAFEADGVTPATLMQPDTTPEPGTFWMLVGALAIGLWRRIRGSNMRWILGHIIGRRILY